jgi:Holliday junction resolvase RusA-like endonuclease
MVAFFVAGRVAPQGSKRYVGGNAASGGRFIEASKYLPAWRKAVTTAARAYMGEHGLPPFIGPVELQVTFYMERPKSITRSKRPEPIVPPDLDKLVRAVCDALSDGLVWADDAQVIKLIAWKHYADDTEPGADIQVFPLDTPGDEFHLEV